MNDFIAGTMVGLIVAVLISMVLLATYNPYTENQWHRIAVDAGKAEYYMDKDFNKQWRWK